MTQPGESILIVDFGSQVTQLIARRVREAGVYSEIAPFTAAAEAFDRMKPGGVILSGSPASVLEDGSPRVPDAIFESGIPVLGHLGLTPQSVHQLGYRRQARDPIAQDRLRRQAERLEAVGCFALVLEHIPAELATELSRDRRIPVIGIGAGEACDGQVRVTADLLGLTSRQPPFSPPLLDGRGLAVQALRQWISAQRPSQPATRPAAPAAPHC